jgi:gliding motility-associated protein GldM
MAGLKETPRQRMIGMMYLVLTALLALQVSSAIIFKFQSLNESLEHTVKESAGWNNLKLASISDEVVLRGNRKEEVTLVNSAREISTHSSELIKHIEKLKKELIQESGGYDDEGNLKGAKEETKVEVIMIGANKSGKGYELKKKLLDYEKLMSMRSSTKFSSLALDGKDDPMFKNNNDQKNKDFVELNFGQTPLVASLAILSELQSRISTMEATTLAELSGKIGINDFKFDRLMPMTSPTSRVVAAGTKYEAQVFMTATSSTQKPVIEFGSTPVEVDNNGVGKISFTAAGGNYVNGMVKKTWTGKITMKNPEGKDTTYNITEEYVVAQPVIQIQAKAVQALYKNCGNKLDIQVPALGTSYNPVITADGATVISGSTRGTVTVLPTNASVKLKVSSGGNYIGDQTYRVKLIPLPTIDCKVNGRAIDPIRGVTAGEARSITVTPIADKEFKDFLPDDSYYQITEWKLTIARGRSGGAVKTFNTQSVNLGSLAQELRPNDRIIIEVTKVRRRNFKGEFEDVKLSAHQSTFFVPVN